MRTLRLVLEYDGTDFAGWQAQRSGLRTVQGEVESVLTRILREPAKLHTAGRTDTGVHAQGQVTSLRTECNMPLWRLARALNGLLPGDVTVRSVAEVPAEFHARFSAVERRYRYRLLARPSAMWERHAWWPWMTLDAAALTEAFAPLVGEHDFRAFAGREPARAPLAHGRCNVKRLRFVPWEEGIALEVWSNRFLYHMVRNFVGTATAITKGTRKAEELPAILASCDRREAGPTAPPMGLSLEAVVYPERWAPLSEVVDGWGRVIAGSETSGVAG